VIPSECLTTQHKLLFLDMAIRSPMRRKKTVDFRVKWWNLAGDNVAKLSKKIKRKASRQ